MASRLLSPSLGASSITPGGSYCRSKRSAKVYYAGSDVTTLWNKIGKIQRKYTLMTSLQQNLKYHYKGIEGGSACQESEGKYVVNATSKQSYEDEPQAQHLESIWDSAKHAWDILSRFIRPYAAIGLATGATSASFLAVERLSDLSATFFIGWLLALVTSFCMNTIYSGLNGLCDVEIDKINKPYLPLASGEVSFGTGVLIVVSSFILSAWLALTVDSWPLFWTVVAAVVLALQYNVDLPLLRWKKSTVLTAINFCLSTAIIPLGFFFHMQTVMFKRPATFPRQLIFSTAIIIPFFVVIALFKDIPDIEGDKKFGIQTLAARLGGKKIFWICISLLEIAYGATILVGATSPFLWSKIVTGLGHAILALILWYRAKFVDLKSKASVQSFYMVIWKLLYAEYFLMPLFR